MGFGPKSGSFLASVADIVGSRALDTVYQNTSSRPRYVSILADGDLATRDMSIQVGSANPPTQTIARDFSPSSVNAPTTFSFWVPPGWYYRAVTNSDPWTLQGWLEGTL